MFFVVQKIKGHKIVIFERKNKKRVSDEGEMRSRDFESINLNVWGNVNRKKHIFESIPVALLKYTLFSKTVAIA